LGFRHTHLSYAQTIFPGAFAGQGFSMRILMFG